MRMASGCGLIGLAGALALSTAGCERRDRAEALPGAATKESHQLEGTVRETRSDELRVSDDTGRERTIHANEQTQVFIGDRPVVSIAEVPEGARVRASFPTGDTERPALRIDVVESGGAPASPDGGR